MMEMVLMMMVVVVRHPKNLLKVKMVKVVMVVMKITRRIMMKHLKNPK